MLDPETPPETPAAPATEPEPLERRGVSRRAFLGVAAGSTNTTGHDNTFIGLVAGGMNTTGSNNQFIGSWAGYSNTEGSNNNFVGVGAGYSNTTGRNNTFIIGSDEYVVDVKSRSPRLVGSVKTKTPVVDLGGGRTVALDATFDLAVAAR